MVAFFEYLADSWPGWVFTVFSGLIAYMYTQIKAMRMGILAMLRADIIRLYNKYHDELGYCPVFVKQALEDEYVQYHALKGNGMITALYNKLMALPTEPREED